MTERPASVRRPRGWRVASLLGLAPHLVLLGFIWWPRPVYFGWEEGAEAAIPFALYGTWELFIVPASLLLAVVAAVVDRTRPFAPWLLLGTLAGGTVVLLALAQAAVSWDVVMS